MDPDTKDVIDITSIVKKFIAKILQNDEIFVMSECDHGVGTSNWCAHCCAG